MLDAARSSTPYENVKDSVLKQDIEEECSFLKIENVVSLAPTVDGSEDPIVSHYVSYLFEFFSFVSNCKRITPFLIPLQINDIRKAVETSPIKNISLLKKPIILKRLNTVTIAQPLTKNIQTVQSIPEKVKLIPMKSISPSPVTTTQIATNFIPIAPK